MNAMIHPNLSLRWWASEPARFGVAPIPDAEEVGLPPTADVALRCLYDLVRQDCCGPRFSEMVPSNARLAVLCGLAEELQERDVVERWRNRDWDWPGESWLEGLKASGIEPGTISVVVKYAEVERLRSWLAGMDALLDPKWRTEVGHPLYRSLLEERGRQLLAMSDAMNGFAEGVYATTGDHS